MRNLQFALYRCLGCRGALQFLDVGGERVLHVLERVAQQVYLVVALDGGQGSIELSVCHLVGDGSQLFQRLCSAPDGKTADEEGDEQHQGDNQQREIPHADAHNVERQRRQRYHQGPVCALQWRIKQVVLHPVDQHHPVGLVVTLLAVFHLPDGLLSHAGLVGILDMDVEVAFQDTPLVGVYDIGAVARQYETVEQVLVRYVDVPHVLFEDVGLLKDETGHEVERQVGAKNGHDTSLLVVDGIHIGYQRCLPVAAFEEGLRPIGGVGGYGIAKPFGLQIGGFGIFYRLSHHGSAVFSPGIRTVGFSFVWEVVLDETDAATADAGVLPDDALHDGLQLFGLLDVLFYLEEVVVDSHADIRHHVADALSIRYHAAMESIGADIHHYRPCQVVDEVCQTAHHDEQHEHHPPCQSSGKRMIVFLILHIPFLVVQSYTKSRAVQKELVLFQCRDKSTSRSKNKKNVPFLQVYGTFCMIK